MRAKNTKGGFSLYEILIAVGILALIGAFAIPQVQKAGFSSKLEIEKANIVLIQDAKEAYAADNPGLPITDASALLPYLPDQQLPKSPFGTEYKNLTDLSKPVASGSSDVPAPTENNFVAIAKSEASGFGPLDFTSSPPGYVVVSAPLPTPTLIPTTPPPAVNNNPSVLLRVNPSTVYRGETVTLTANAVDIDGDVLSYNFGSDGSRYDQGNVNTLGLSYGSLGTKSLLVDVTDGKGGSASASASVNIINRIPAVSLSQSLTNTHRNNSVKFTALGSDGDNDGLTYQFKINNDAPLAAGAGSILDRSFTSLGKQTVSVAVNDGFGGVGAASAELTITNRPPTASLVSSLSSTTVNKNVTFATTASDPDNDPLSYTYTVDGTAFAKSSNPVLTRSFSTLGTKNVSVLVEDGFGGSVTAATAVSVTGPPNLAPYVTAYATPTSGIRGQNFTFTARGVDPEKDTLTYSFNDGAYSPTKSFTQSYSTLGTKSVTVKAKDSKGAESAPAVVSVNVTNRIPLVTITASPTSGLLGNSFTFTANGSDPDGDSIEYSFNGGAYSLANTFTTSFSVGGTKVVSVKVRDAFGAESLPESASVVVLGDKLWDAVVLYRGVESRWLEWANDPTINAKTLGELDPNKKLNLVNPSGLAGTIEATGNEGSWMTPVGWELAAYMLNQPGLYSDLITNSGNNGVVILRYVDPSTKETTYQLGYTADSRDSAVGIGTMSFQFYNSGRSFTTQNKAPFFDIRINRVGWQYETSPIILDLNFSGYPDLLAGKEAWKRGRKDPIIEKSLRNFDLDGKGAKDWEWVGPTAGVLIWGSDTAGINGTRLFGNVTWGKSWKDGYEPLATLDKNKDGVLKAEELDGLYIWTDANSDAKATPSEIKSLVDQGIVELSVLALRDEVGNSYQPVGFKDKTGKVGASWDWWSRSQDRIQTSSAEDKVSFYEWKPLDMKSQNSGGVFMVVDQANGESFIVAFKELPKEKVGTNDAGIIGFKYPLVKDGKIWRWSDLDSGNGVVNEAVFEGENLVGTTQMISLENSQSSFSWAAVPRYP